MQYRIGIQILSYNKPKYLKQTLDSLYTKISKDDKICIVEQTEDANLKQECLNICKTYSNIYIISLDKNLGQRGATNKVFDSGFFNDTKYVMLSDHDNLFHEKLDVYCNILDKYPDIWISSGYNSPEHDIETKIDDILLKSSARAGHMVLRTSDFLSMMPCDLNAGKDLNCIWFAGLDWLLTHWSPKSPGYKRSSFIGCYSGGVEHIGRESTWQNFYDDEYDIETLNWFRTANLYEIVKKYPPRHTYISGKYWYENISDAEFRNLLHLPIEIDSKEEKIKSIFKETFNIDSVSNNNINNIKSRLIDNTSSNLAVNKTYCVTCTHYYSKDRNDEKYKYTRHLFSLELWRRRIRFNLGPDIKIIVFDDTSEYIDRIINYIDELVEIFHIENIDQFLKLNLINTFSKFTIVRFSNHLGRQKEIFSGWLRSFKACLSLDVDYLYFNELDLLTNITFKDFNTDYLCGMLSNMDSIESSLQIFNRPSRNLLLDNFDKINTIPERDIYSILKPYIINNSLISGMRVDEDPSKGIDLINSPLFWIANPSNLHFETFYNKFNISLNRKNEKLKTIIAFNYIWPEYGLGFFEKSIQNIIPKVHEYHLFINKYSYYGTKASDRSIQEVNDICKRNNHLGTIIVHYNDTINEDVKKGNVLYYFKTIIELVKSYADYVWLVQSDEVYDLFSVDDVIDICNQDIIPACGITQPICYFDNPHWFINPPEKFTRPSIINVKNPDINSRELLDISFHHMSYVLTRNDLKLKFNNWGHKNDIKENLDNFNNIFDNIKTNKSIKNLHPIIPEIYNSVGFMNSQINQNLFLDWIYYLMSNNEYTNLELFKSDLDHHVQQFITSLISEIIPLESLYVEIGYKTGLNLLAVKKISPLLKIIGFDNNFKFYENSYRTIMNSSSINNIHFFHNTYKFLIPKLRNSSVDCVFFNNIENSKDLETSIIEIWPKMKHYSIMFGIYDKTNTDFINILNKLITDANQIECPWGIEQFRFYEIYMDLFKDIENYKNIDLNSTTSIWFARVRK